MLTLWYSLTIDLNDFDVFKKEITPYATSKTPPKIRKLGSSFIFCTSLLVLKKLQQ